MRWLWRLLVTDADRRAIESDLAELYEYQRQRYGDRAARHWRRRQLALLPLHILIDRLRSAATHARNAMRHIWQDVTYSGRSLARTPALAATIVLTVGLGLGGTTAMLSVVRAVLMNPLPYAQADDLVWIYTDNPPHRFPLSVMDYRTLEADHPAFSEIAAWRNTSLTMTDGSQAERSAAKIVTASYFSLFAHRAALGRLIDAGDERRREAVVVLGYAFWQRRFGGDPSVLGRALTLDGTAHTVVGVLEERHGPFERTIALFVPARWPAPTRRGPFFLAVAGRLRPGVTPAAAVASLRATNARHFPPKRPQDERSSWGMVDLKERVVGDVGPRLLFVLGAVGCVLLIASANAVNLLIARALRRQRELAIRRALGASRRRVMQHVFVETSLLALTAGLAGLAIAAGAIGLVTVYAAEYIPRIDEVRLSAPVLAWFGALVCASAALMGLVPALYASAPRVNQALADGRSASEGPAARRVRRALVAAEFAVATPLLVAAALVLISLTRLSRVDVGIDPAHVLTAGLSLPGSRYPQPADRDAFWHRALDRLAILPGVEAAAFAESRPPQEAMELNDFELEGRPVPAGQSPPVSVWVGVSERFFKTLSYRLERGRLLAAADFEDDAPLVIVVDRAWATRFFPNQDVIGRRLHSGGCNTCAWTTVVGVVNTVKFEGLGASDNGVVYTPSTGSSRGFLMLRTVGDPASLSKVFQAAIQELDPGLALESLSTGNELMATAMEAPRYLTVVIGLFAITAVLLSLVGIYGVMAHFVQQHARDIGIRLALGGEPSAMRRLVVWHGLRLVAIGIAAGMAAAYLIARGMTTKLFGVALTDPSTLLAVPLLLALVAVLACLAPGRRAARLDPALLLRDS
jgi:putative ABC transport system permease protein